MSNTKRRAERKKRGLPPERFEGPIAAIPHVVMESPAFRDASPTAQALLLWIAKQHNGWNNGHLQVTQSWLRKRGWLSNGTVTRAKGELMERQLIAQTRSGGFLGGSGHPGLFALTWLDISNPTGLDPDLVARFKRGAWANTEPAPRNVERTMAATNSRKKTAHRQTVPAECSSEPLHGEGKTSSAPPDGSVSANFRDPPSPSDGSYPCFAMGG